MQLNMSRNDFKMTIGELTIKKMDLLLNIGVDIKLRILDQVMNEV